MTSNHLEQKIAELTQTNAILLEENERIKRQFEESLKISDEIDGIFTENAKLNNQVSSLQIEKANLSNRLKISLQSIQDLNSKFEEKERNKENPKKSSLEYKNMKDKISSQKKRIKSLEKEKKKKVHNLEIRLFSLNKLNFFESWKQLPDSLMLNLQQRIFAE